MNNIQSILQRLNLLEQNINNQSKPETENIAGEIVVVEKEEEEEQKEEPERCCICLEDLSEDKNFVALECGHKLNFTCFIQLMNSDRNVKCPLCRVDLGIFISFILIVLYKPRCF